MQTKEIKVSPEFISHTKKAIVAIILFAIVYILLVSAVVFVTIMSLYGALMIIMIYPSFITGALGIGLAGLGVSILFFIIKFIFRSTKIDRSHLVEIHAKDEPELFEMIDDIVKQVGTNFPKKIYLSSDVNASVFYDSNFWSMFLPIKKNLQIGLGLVNTVSKTELKAILAHEFGHFSQRTMKVGSYVYNVNQVIYNMLNEDESYNKIIQFWANLSAYFAFFVVIAMRIIQAIQWVLRKMYEFINTSYLALSREMEFHADEVAANVCGYPPLKNSLLRMNLADHSFNSVLNFYETKIPENIVSSNLYTDQKNVLTILAHDNGIPIVNNLPLVTTEYLNRYNKSKLVIKDQWASHPSTEDRIEKLEKTNLVFDTQDERPANEIFLNIEQTQQKITKKTFENVKYEGDITLFSPSQFKDSFLEDLRKNSFSKIYNGYYDNKNPLAFELDKNESTSNTITFDDLFSNEKIDLVYTSIALQNDLIILNQIADKTLRLKTFDYEGVKYDRKKSKELIKRIDSELTDLNEKIKENDFNIYTYFKNLEKLQKRSENLTDLYTHFFEFDKNFDDEMKVYNDLSNALSFISQVTPFEQITENFINIEPLEHKLKEKIKVLLENSVYQDEITQEIKDNFELYLSKNWDYFRKESYIDSNLETLFKALNNYGYLLMRGYFLIKKDLLEYQALLKG